MVALELRHLTPEFYHHLMLGIKESPLSVDLNDYISYISCDPIMKQYSYTHPQLKFKLVFRRCVVLIHRGFQKKTHYLFCLHLSSFSGQTHWG